MNNGPALPVGECDCGAQGRMSAVEMRLACLHLIAEKYAVIDRLNVDDVILTAAKLVLFVETGS